MKVFSRRRKYQGHKSLRFPKDQHNSLDKGKGVILHKLTLLILMRNPERNLEMIC
jgi:hypothetical protein